MTFEAENGSEWTLVEGGDAAHGFAVDVGERIEVSETYADEGSFAPKYSSIVIRHEKGSVRFWYASGGEVAEVSAPHGFGVSLGEVACRGEVECGWFDAFDLFVTTPDAEGSIGYSRTKRVGDFEASHIEALYQLPNQGSQCADWFMARIGIVVRRAR